MPGFRNAETRTFFISFFFNLGRCPNIDNFRYLEFHYNKKINLQVVNEKLSLVQLDCVTTLGF